MSSQCDDTIVDIRVVRNMYHGSYEVVPPWHDNTVRKGT